jgi:transcriptional regulator with XRE-family HTH domain
MITLEEIRQKLSDRNLSEVARRTGVSYRTLFSICNGTNKNPSYESVRAIVEYLNNDK